jgi:hypothetical protein
VNVKRVERSPRVYYIERPLLGSVLCLALSLGILLLGQIGQSAERRESDRREAIMGTLVYALPLAGAALVLLFRVRAFAIDRAEGELLVFERRFPWTGLRKAFPIEQLSVRRVTLPGRGLFGEAIYHAVWIDPVGSPSILFRSVRSGAAVVELAERLAADLGRPLTGVDRTR